MLGYRLVRSLLMAAVVMVAIPSAANAQAYASKIWAFDVSGGIALPLGALKEVASSGPTFGAGATYFVSDLFGVRLEGNVDLLKGNEDGLDVTIPSPGGPSQSDISGAPNISLYHLTGGFDFNLINRTDSKFRFQIFLLGGAVFVNSQKVDFRDPSPSDTGDLGCDPPLGTDCLVDWQDAYPQFRGGLRLGFEVGDCTPARARICGEISIHGGAHVMFGNEEDSDPLANLYGESGFGTFTDLPLGLNIRINIL